MRVVPCPLTMFPVMNTVVALSALMILGISAEDKGVDLTLDRDILLPSEDGASCSRLVCRAKGNSGIINSVAVSKVKVNGVMSELLVLTTNKPKIEIVCDKIRGNGSLEDNSAIIYIDARDMSSCESDVFTCEVGYIEKDGDVKVAFAISGSGKLPSLQSLSPQEKEGPTTVTTTQSNASPYTSRNPYLSELWFLGDKITKVERKFDTSIDRLERRITQNMESVQRRAGTLENSVLERVTSAETDFSSRVSRLEDRVSSLLLTQSPDSSSDVDQTLVDMERRLEDVERTLDQIKTSKAVPEDGRHNEEQPQSCERGMGFDVTKNYPPYVIMHHETIQKQILCDTHTDGGGWIIFQRRTKGDIDFYRDWSAYKNGFGTVEGDFWMGNDALHKLTDEHPYELRVDMRYQSKEWFAEYSSFRIDDESNKYKLHLGSASGTAQNGDYDLSYHKDMYFTTFDRDNDASGDQCAISYHGAWWYKSCHYSNLNGLWGEDSSKGVRWYTGSQSLYPYFTEMKVRRVRSNISG